jgi:hypothetical protein
MLIGVLNLYIRTCATQTIQIHEHILDFQHINATCCKTAVLVSSPLVPDTASIVD